MRKSIRFRLSLLLLLLLGGAAQAQVVTAGPDSTAVAPTQPSKAETAAADSARRTERLFGLRLSRPGKAAVLAIIPGGGQIYNKRYWKLPLVYGLLGTLGGLEYHYQSRYREYVTGYEERLLGHADPGPRSSKELSPQGVQAGIVFYRRNRDMFILYLAVGYSLQILDAVVDAHLYNFDVSDDLALEWSPALLPVPGQPLPGLGATVALRLK